MVTEEYYTDIFCGVAVDDLKRRLVRASHEVEALISMPLDAVSAENKEAVKKAICAQVESSKSLEASSLGNVRIGSFSMGGGASQSKPKHVNQVLNYLYPTGYLYAGVTRYGNTHSKRPTDT